MLRDDLGDLVAFVVVAEERSFTRAAAKLGTSQSALSHTIRRIETRLGLNLLTRTTRSVAPTEAGERLLETLRPALDDIEARIDALSALREKPAGTVRITAGHHAVQTVLWPVLSTLLHAYPEIRVEVSVDGAFRDIVAERFDAGVRLGEAVEKDMIAVRIGPPLRMIVVGAPSYFARHALPEVPHDLTQHRCLNVRLPSQGGLYAWEFEKEGREVKVRVEGPLIVNDGPTLLQAAVEGLGLALTFEDAAAAHLAAGRLIPVLDDWCAPFPGYHLYYPSRRQPAPAFAVLVEALRRRASVA
jgi:DNA-binding transcriptional LysR family regulator